MIGGLMGALMITAKRIKIDGLPVTFIFVFFGVSVSLVASDIILINLGWHRLSAHLTLGAASGSVGGAMMPAIRAVSMPFADTLVKIATETAEGVAKITSKALLGLSESRVAKALSILFGKDK